MNAIETYGTAGRQGECVIVLRRMLNGNIYCWGISHGKSFPIALKTIKNCPVSGCTEAGFRQFVFYPPIRQSNFDDCGDRIRDAIPNIYHMPKAVKEKVALPRAIPIKENLDPVNEKVVKKPAIVRARSELNLLGSLDLNQ